MLSSGTTPDTTAREGNAQDTPAVVAELMDGDRLSLAQAAELFPPGRQGRPCSPSCVWRWISSGTKAADGRTVRLESAKAGKRVFTSRAAVRRFLVALNAPAGAAPPAPRPAAVPSHAKAAGELRKRGV